MLENLGWGIFGMLCLLGGLWLQLSNMHDTLKSIDSSIGNLDDKLGDL